MYALTAFLTGSWIKYIVLFIGGLCIFAGYRCFFGLDLPWNIDLAVLGVAFLCLGKAFYMLCPNFSSPKTIHVLLIALIGILWLTTSWINFHYWGKTDWYSNQFGNPLLFPIAAVSGTLFLVSVCHYINIPVISFIGRNSLVFYGLHRIIIDNLYVMLGKIGMQQSNETIGYFIISLMVVISAVLILVPINYIILKFLPWCIGKKCAYKP